jgi:hypothetical protein
MQSVERIVVRTKVAVEAARPPLLNAWGRNKTPAPTNALK